MTMGTFVEVFVCFCLLSAIRTSTAVDTISPGQSIRDGDTIVSSGQTYELGFFSPGSSSGRYVGIWFKKISTGTVVWVANRETPIRDRSGVLNFTDQGILLLLNRTNGVIWSSNKTRTARNPIAQLLDSGNFVVKDENDANPKIIYGTALIIQSLDDPARGDYTAGIDPHGYPQLLYKKGNKITFRAGSWNGIRFTGAARLRPNPVYTYEFVLNEKEVYYNIHLRNRSVMSRLVVNSTGVTERLTWIDQTHSWARYFAVGFEPKSERDWSFQDWTSGCARKTALACKRGEGFVKHPGMKMPDTSGSWFNRNMCLKECEDLCLKNCSCVAYANTDITAGSGCLLWFNEIKKKRESRREKRIGIIVCTTILGTGVLVLGWILYMRKRRIKLREKMRSVIGRDYNDQSRNEDLELPIIDLITIMKTTDNFSSENKLGEGGFGPVYKGIFLDGQEIAVKRLSMSSGQGLEEFKNEVLLIAKLQHRNLVKLLGCCIEGDERMLIYEYMPIKAWTSLYLVYQSRSKLLDWNKRINIIDGIARGLLYLHQDSRLRIIHRDLKASNVLLDKDMNPKISDFGMARIFGGDQTEANTNRVVGTFGYMAPEYAVDGLFSVKSDIFSFGVLVLEIVSGRKNRGFHSHDHLHNLVGHAWRLWMEERPLELIDNMLEESAAFSEIIRCIHVGLLCVQKRPEDRPNMSTVVLMLGGESSLPQPKQPGFFTERFTPEAESSSSNYRSTSTNEITVTMLDPR
ncbi:hypothetical protein GH714_008907 [Hevea brasiliensis]|uniref:Receptor-like serine/threonine-protein kinase n=1 Tax=Hevea brasiliensis TaxID=3981 RepID=A0A6A6KAK7_HEVBR|nr:hypothetical protein GH714_008907 [Hevea brasiliensis]